MQVWPRYTISTELTCDAFLSLVVGGQLVPELVTRVNSLTGHSCHLVRTRALVTLDHLVSQEPGQWGAARAAVLARLADPSPGVAAAAIQVSAAPPLSSCGVLDCR